MLTKKKTIIYSILAATLLTTSVGHAKSFSSGNLKYNQTYNSYYGRGYNINYNYSKPNYNTTTNGYPIFKWEVVNKSQQKPTPTIPEVPAAPEAPTVPETPAVPEVPAVPETPTKPTIPNTPTVPTPSQPETSTPSVSGLSAIEMEVVRLVNIERQKEGLKPFTASSELSNVARKKSEDMAKNNYFSHTSPTYGSPFDMMKSFGIKYNTAGENIAKGQLSAQSVVTGWMNSPGHRANIMNSSFNKIGVGYYQSSSGTNLWTQMFTN